MNKASRCPKIQAIIEALGRIHWLGHLSRLLHNIKYIKSSICHSAWTYTIFNCHTSVELGTTNVFLKVVYEKGVVGGLKGQSHEVIKKKTNTQKLQSHGKLVACCALQTIFQSTVITQQTPVLMGGKLLVLNGTRISVASIFCSECFICVHRSPENRSWPSLILAKRKPRTKKLAVVLWLPLLCSSVSYLFHLNISNLQSVCLRSSRLSSLKFTGTLHRHLFLGKHSLSFSRWVTGTNHTAINDFMTLVPI